MLSKTAVDTSWSHRRINRHERLSMRAAIALGSLATLVLWFGLTEVLVQWM